MCLASENQYDKCFDFLFIGAEAESLIKLLEGYGVVIKNEKLFKQEILRTLELLDLAEIIQPH